MRNFRSLKIWNNSVQFCTHIYKLSSSFPSSEKFGLCSQMTRAAVSIPSNIAEGCRGSDKEMIYFLNLALGSSFELETQLEIAQNVNFISVEVKEEYINTLNNLQRSINAFRTSIKNKTKA